MKIGSKVVVTIQFVTEQAEFPGEIVLVRPKSFDVVYTHQGGTSTTIKFMRETLTNSNGRARVRLVP
jgi:hypothetical protein